MELTYSRTEEVERISYILRIPQSIVATRDTVLKGDIRIRAQTHTIEC